MTKVAKNFNRFTYYSDEDKPFGSEPVQVNIERKTVVRYIFLPIMLLVVTLITINLNQEPPAPPTPAQQPIINLHLTIPELSSTQPATQTVQPSSITETKVKTPIITKIDYYKISKEEQVVIGKVFENKIINELSAEDLEKCEKLRFVVEL